MPSFFSDAGWERINNTILSTSNCGNPALRHFGFGPVSGDGFGIGYIIKDDSISVCASSKHRQTKRFVDSLESYLNEIRRLLRATKSKDVAVGKVTRAREAEDKVGKDGRLKSRGRVIKTENARMDGAQTPTSMDTAEVDDDGLGGCTYFHLELGGLARLTWMQMVSSMLACSCKHSRRIKPNRPINWLKDVAPLARSWP